MKQKKENRWVVIALFLLFIQLPLKNAFAQCELPTEIQMGAQTLDQMQSGAVDLMVESIKTAVTLSEQLVEATYTTPEIGLIPIWGVSIRSVMRKWIDGMIKKGFAPMTQQLNAIKVDQARNLGTSIETENQTKTQREIQVREAQSVKKFTPNEYACVADSSARYAAEAQSTARAVESGIVTEISDMGLNTAGSAVDDGRGEGINQRWKIYSENFCNNQANNGAAGCAAALPDAGADVAVGKTLFRNETIDLKTPANQLAVKELVQNLASFEPAERIKPNTLNNATGREYMLRQRRLQAQMNAVTGVLSGIVGERAPGSGTVAAEVAAARRDAGVPASEISDTPSKRELRQAVIDKLWSPQFYRDLGDEPNTIIQKEVYLKAYSNALLYDLIAKTEQVAMLFSVQLGNMSDEVGVSSGAVSARPVMP